MNTKNFALIMWLVCIAGTLVTEGLASLVLSINSVAWVFLHIRADLAGEGK